MISIWAVIAGAGVGLLGGLIGLGGAEFRLPLLVAMFRYALRRAISLNLAISFVAVLVGAAARWGLGGQAPPWSAAPIAVAMMVGGMLGAAVGSHWLARVSDLSRASARRGGSVLDRSLSPGSVSGRSVRCPAWQGRVIIPTLVFGFGLPIKVAGTMSLLISIPTMAVALSRHRASGAFQDVRDLERIVLPMALGTVLGSIVGGWLVVLTPSSVVKLILGCVLIAAALRVFKIRAHVGPEGTSPSVAIGRR